MQPHPKLPSGGDGGSFFQGANTSTHFPIWVSQSAPHGGNVLGSFFFPEARLGGRFTRDLLLNAVGDTWSSGRCLEVGLSGGAPPFHHDLYDQHHSMNSPPERDSDHHVGGLSTGSFSASQTEESVTKCYLVEYVTQSGKGVLCESRVVCDLIGGCPEEGQSACRWLLCRLWVPSTGTGLICIFMMVTCGPGSAGRWSLPGLGM